MIYVKIAWRNLIKHPRKTLILVMAIAIGFFCISFFLGLINGFYVRMVENAVDTSLGHLQINHREFRQKQDAQYFIENPEEIIEIVKNTPHITGYSSRVLVQGMVSSPEKSHHTMITGIDPVQELAVTRALTDLERGEAVSAEDMEGILLGRAMAESLKVDLDDKVVIMIHNLEGEMEGAAFRVRGIFKAPTSDFEKINVYISINQARSLLKLPAQDGIHQIALRVDDAGHIDESAEHLAGAIEDSRILVETWAQLEPLLAQQIEMTSSSSWYLYGIIIIALAFGIINSFMMEIFDRIKEFGIMMSLGTRPGSIFLMLTWEAFFLGVLGVIAGSGLTFAVAGWIFRWELDFSRFAQGMDHFGFSTVVPLIITREDIITTCIYIIIGVVASAVYPAIRAARFTPVEAIRHV